MNVDELTSGLKVKTKCVTKAAILNKLFYRWPEEIKIPTHSQPLYFGFLLPESQ